MSYQNIDYIEGRIENLERKFSEKITDNVLDDFMMKMDTKIKMFEEILNSMKMCVIEKDDLIVNLEAKVKSMESKF